MFNDLFDPLLQAKYDYGSSARQYHDMDVTKLRFPFQSETSFDMNKYVLSSRIRVTRNLSGFTFPTFCTRAERRRVEGTLSKAFERLGEKEKYLNGNYYRLSTIDERLQEKLVNVSTSMSEKNVEGTPASSQRVHFARCSDSIEIDTDEYSDQSEAKRMEIAEWLSLFRMVSSCLNHKRWVG